MNRRTLPVLVSLAGLIGALGAAPVAAPATSAIDIGPAKLYTQTDPTALLTGVQLDVPAGLDRESDQQNGLATLAAETILEHTVDGSRLREVIAARGGSLTYSVGLQDTRFYLEAPPDQIAGIADLVAKALAAPDTTAPTLAAARAAIAARISDDESNPVAVGSEMLRASYYNGGAGLPINGTPASLAALTGGDVSAFIAAHYRRGSAIVTAVGRVTPAVTTAGRTLTAALAEGTDPGVTTQARAFGTTPKRIVAQRDIGVPYVMIGFAAPSVSDKDFAAMLVLRALLADVFDRPSATTLPGFEHSVGVLYSYDVKPASLAIYINGQQTDPTAGLSSVNEVLRDLAFKPLTDPLIKHYRTSARGAWQTDAVSLADRAFNLSTFVEQGVDPDFARTELAAIDAVTAADVQRVANAYLQKFTVALIVPRDRTPNG